MNDHELALFLADLSEDETLRRTVAKKLANHATARGIDIGDRASVTEDVLASLTVRLWETRNQWGALEQQRWRPWALAVSR